jgi:hypothetical protein
MNQIEAINNLGLNKVPLRDRPYILYWDHPEQSELEHLAFRYTAERVSYRDNLITRHTNLSKSEFLNLDMHSDRELEALKQICQESIKPLVILEDLDILFAYFVTRVHSPIDLLWKKLADTRQLACLLWIVLPSTLTAKYWDETRIKYLKNNMSETFS